MHLNYTIENYYPAENRIFCIFTSTDTNESYGSWVSISNEMTKEQVDEAINVQAPYHMFNVRKSSVIEAMIGTSSSIDKQIMTTVASQSEPQLPTVDNREQLERLLMLELNSFVRLKNYRSFDNVCTYISSSIPEYVADAQKVISLRDSIWPTFYALMDTPNGPNMTISELMAQLPALTWEA